MHTILALQITIGELAALDGHRHALDTSLIAFLHIGDGYLVAMSLSPAHIHTHQHLGRTTGTGIDLEHAVHRIFLLAKHVLQLQVFDGLDSLAVIGIHLFLGHHFVLIEIEGELQFIGIKAHGLIAIEPFLDALHLLHLLLRIFWILPKVRSLGAELLLLEFYFLLVDIEIMMESIGSVHHIFQLVSCNH